ncbi:hypothetical protein [Paraliomyxa miuraensis]|uniref:hypothetical protein n=1 Tax=Paraliomyxa miuraensis TaxID=376150 RepID=UPI00225C1CC8|nr:hypothetical protein [Paraliomyxa miuraensis]MCX4240749.1 hypothetical protein [Paraliomyxa miuraensis]
MKGVSRAEWGLGLALVGCAAAGTGASSEPDSAAAERAPELEMQPEVEEQEGAAASGDATVAPSAKPASGDGASKIAPPMTVEAITGVPDCDAYLELYARCEGFLRPQIMAGDRRFYPAEKGWLLHLAQSPEAPTLPEACAEMLDGLRTDCPEDQRTPAVAEGS